MSEAHVRAVKLVRAAFAGLLGVNWMLFAWLIVIMYSRGQPTPDPARNLTASVNLHGTLYVTPGQSQLFDTLSLSLFALTAGTFVATFVLQYVERPKKR